ncbi:hypothetical protein T484DRAFT_1852168 [Baffinella frigidus]|nr:hypothetical protein T484DRAFT_1852168 [Cryptophyta sp. CCMP2293]
MRDVVQSRRELKAAIKQLREDMSAQFRPGRTDSTAVRDRGAMHFPSRSPSPAPTPPNAPPPEVETSERWALSFLATPFSSASSLAGHVAREVDRAERWALSFLATPSSSAASFADETAQSLAGDSFGRTDANEGVPPSTGAAGSIPPGAPGAPSIIERALFPPTVSMEMRVPDAGGGSSGGVALAGGAAANLMKVAKGRRGGDAGLVEPTYESEGEDPWPRQEMMGDDGYHDSDSSGRIQLERESF